MKGAALARKTDAVTRWWRGISLRAKVTGVTVILLAMALLAAGSGTFAFLRSTLVSQVDTNISQLVTADVASDVFTVTISDSGEPVFSVRDPARSRAYFVAMYNPDGTLEISAGGSGGPEPAYPADVSPESATTGGGATFTLPGSGDSAPFRAAIAPHTVTIDDDSKQLYTELVAAPLAPTERIVALFVGIYSVLSLAILVGIGLLTRWLVTLTFRGLGQVEATAMAIAAGDFRQRMTDIEPRTEVGKLKRAINTMLDRIDRAISQRDSTVQQMRRFIGDASHELRTPLVTVRGYAELYRMGGIPDQESTAQAMSRIEKEAIRMGLLVEDLLSLARLDERRGMTITAVDLLMVARDAALDVQASSPQRPIRVIDAATSAGGPGEGNAESSNVEGGDGSETQAAASQTEEQRATADTKPIPVFRAGPMGLLRRRARPAPTAPLRQADTAPPRRVVPVADSVLIWGDENRVRQVVANLLGNARRFTAETSPIELRVGIDQNAETGCIEVIDHGEGIPDPIKAKIFERFWRADTSRTRETGGTGLGLSIVASIVDALKASVTVTDTADGGATFAVSFPLALPRADEQSGAAERE